MDEIERQNKSPYCECCKKLKAECDVLVEFRAIRKARETGDNAPLRAYHEQCRQRREELERQRADPEKGPQLWRAKARQAGAPFQSLEALKGDLESCSAMDAAKNFVETPAALFLLLLGNMGVGKTLAATFVVSEFCKRYPWNDRPSGGSQHSPVLFLEAQKFTRMSAFGDADAARFDAALKAELLVVDDIGDECTDLGKNTLTDLLFQRHAKNRRTVITGNVNHEAFKKRYGEPLADRIRSSGFIPTLKGTSMRKAMGARR